MYCSFPQHAFRIEPAHNQYATDTIYTIYHATPSTPSTPPVAWFNSCLFEVGDDEEEPKLGVTTPTLHQALRHARVLATKNQTHDAKEGAVAVAGFTGKDVGKQATIAGAHVTLVSPGVSCLKWRMLSGAPGSGGNPAKGRELINAPLAAALRRKMCAAESAQGASAGSSKIHFTNEEWADFGVRDLGADHYIKVGPECCFTPTSIQSGGQKEEREVYWMESQRKPQGGLRWSALPHPPALGGERLHHPALEAALASGKATFSQHEMERLGITTVRPGCYVLSGDRYFTPTDGEGDRYFTPTDEEGDRYFTPTDEFSAPAGAAAGKEEEEEAGGSPSPPAAAAPGAAGAKITGTILAVNDSVGGNVLLQVELEDGRCEEQVRRNSLNPTP